ncbi:MAG: CusA/CzcA family heavy metal efflux RND transporter [Myxococcaceae bacterium]|nr:CusA/CzcA family heavy metal efflux RND transporter [Myxococcaceae bacterium]
MIDRLAQASVDRRGLVLAVTAAATVAAVVVGLDLRLDALPDLTNNQVLVLTRAQALTPEEVERLVTRPLELSLAGAPGLVEVRSLSRYGISSITAIFQDDVDAYRARQLVSERLASAALPAGVERPELGPLSGGLGEIFHLTLSSTERPLTELHELGRYRVAPLLKTVPGVVEVNAWGGAQRVLWVNASPATLASRGVTLEALQGALQRSIGATAGGALPQGDGQVLVRAVARPPTAAELEAYRVRPALRLGELARVEEGQALRLGAATAEGRGETLYLMVQMLRDANALEVMRGLTAQMDAVRAALPSDVEVHVVYDRAALVRGTLRTVGKNLAEGGLLVMLVLMVFLGNLRAGLLVASVIPLSMAFATAGMRLLGIPGNLMSLGALDFGLLVDGAVVLVEGVFHLVAHRPAPDRPDLRAQVREVAGSSARPIFFAVMVILLVYLPVLSLTGVDGKLFRPMAMTVVLALSAALLLTFTYLPAAASLWLRARDVPHRAPLVVRFLERRFPPVARALAGRPRAVAVGAVLALLGGGAALRSLGVEFTPTLDEGDLVVQTTRRADISLDDAVAEAGALESLLRTQVPEVRSVVSRIGSPAVATDIMGFEQADVFVGLAPRAQWRPGLTREALMREVELLLQARDPGANASLTQPIQMRFNELLGGAVTDMVVSLTGESLDDLARTADAVARAIEGANGVSDVKVLAPPAVPVLTVRPRPLDASQAGLDPGAVLQAVQALKVGLPLGVAYDGQVPIPLALRLEAPPDAALLDGLSLPTDEGRLVPLRRVADVERALAPSLISHRNGARRLLVGFNVRGADLQTAVDAATARVQAQVTVPAGVALAWGGQLESLRAATARLAVVVPLVLLAIAAVLVLAFRSLRTATIIFLHVPFSGVGGALALVLRGLPLSLPAVIGFIALSGVAVMNGVVLLTRVKEREGSGQRSGEAALGAVLERARPVLMTATVAALGFLPMMLAQGPGSEVQRPLATVVVGGLITSTALTLLVLPSLYPLLAARKGTSR